MFIVLRNLKILFPLTIFVIFSSCAELKKTAKEMDKEAVDNFEPEEFVVEKQDVLEETTSLGPKVNKAAIEDKKNL